VSWIEQATAAFGEPSIAFPEPIIRADMNRRCWVWFVDDRNFNLAIDREYSGFRVSANSPGRHVKIWTDGEPTDDDIRSALTCAWPGFAKGGDDRG
jgi:hypothetical protein